MSTAYIGLGSNLNDPRSQIERALHVLGHTSGIELRKASRLFKSKPWGVADQPDFVNAAAEVQTMLGPHELLEVLLDIERKFGRVRGDIRWGPRLLDLDLLFYEGCVMDEAGLHLPHPHLHERAFVLLPLADIAPELLVAGHGTVASLLDKIDTSACEALRAA